MRILHYSLGLPPYRSGGLTKYCTDLMIEQSKSNNEVLLLFPGKMNFIKEGNINIKFYMDYKNVRVYELINPLPVPLLNGIYSPNDFMKKCNKDTFIYFLNELKVEIVHVHTFMGLYKEFLEACKELNIKTVYTTHDYFGICPKVNFIDMSGNLCNEVNCNKCAGCNDTAFSISKIKLLQSSQYRYLKNKGIIQKVKSLKSKVRFKVLTRKKYIKQNDKNTISNEVSEKYKRLNNYYAEMYKLIDKIIFNSSITKQVFTKYLNVSGEILTITHAEINDNRKQKQFSKNSLKLTYLGPDKSYKGYDLICDVMINLKKRGYNDIVLNAYGDIGPNNVVPDNINIIGAYSYKDLESIFKNTDILIVPSKCYETFGFITLEALSYGVPVLVSENVGSKDLILSSKFGLVFNLRVSDIVKEIENIYQNRELLKELNNNILSEFKPVLMKEHILQIERVYNEK